ncbi:MAG: hypothetical protein V4683_15470 [Bacteroidota bacterium]
MKTFKYELKIGLVEWLFIGAGIVAMLLACNNPLSIKPSEFPSPDSTISFNFKAIPDNDYYRPDSTGVYTSDIELYLRTFQEVSTKTSVLLKFKSNNFGVFIIKKDTLYPDDQTLLVLSDFKNFRLNGQFYTYSVGKQNLDFEGQIGKTKKVFKAVFETK